MYRFVLKFKNKVLGATNREIYDFWREISQPSYPAKLLSPMPTPLFFLISIRNRIAGMFLRGSNFIIKYPAG